jgi:hypothetical protein
MITTIEKNRAIPVVDQLLQALTTATKNAALRFAQASQQALVWRAGNHLNIYIFIYLYIYARTH